MPETSADFLDRIDFLRLDASRKLDAARRSDLGQFLTPASIARLMASMLENHQGEVRLLDAGAGVGSLFAAGVAEMCRRESRPQKISVTAYEIDEKLAEYLPDTFELCRGECERVGIQFAAELIQRDFIADTVARLTDGLFAEPYRPQFNCAILNPPYRKIRTESETRLLLRQIGIETSNLYTAFLAVAVQLLEPGGDLTAITPRSFCNGLYFRGFRESFLRTMALRWLHIFESRQQAFRDDEVLQENLILHAIKGASQAARVFITASAGPADDMPLSRVLSYNQVVRPDDPESFIHITSDDLGQQVTTRMAGLSASLRDIGLSVSTGRVVEFRAREFLRPEPEEGTASLIYPAHFARGSINWPKPTGKKPNAIRLTERTQELLVPNEHYVLVRRFSAKEEKRRIVAAVYNARRMPGEWVGFENHLNYFHHNGRGLNLSLAKGLAAFLNSTLVDAYFRQFNGHTQVNATDLRSLRYPTRDQLLALGSHIAEEFPSQAEVDELMAKELPIMTEDKGPDPVRAKKRTAEALEVLTALGFPRAQLNERSALTLLALLGLKPDTPWKEASADLWGITPLMEFFADHYGKTYKPNTRETVRRQTVHQFLDAGLVVANPDHAERPVNSPKAVYQIETSALKLIRSFGTPLWKKTLETYLASIETLKTKYAQARAMTRIPVTLAPGQTITLSPGGQNILVKQIIDEFVDRFTPGGRLLYVGDTEEKFAFFDQQGLTDLERFTYGSHTDRIPLGTPQEEIRP